MRTVVRALSILILAGALAMMVSADASARRAFPANGGTGDAQKLDECPAGWYIIGFAGRVGGWIDQIALICARHHVDNSIAERRTLTPRGGGGGGPIEVNCPRGSVVSGVQYTMTGGWRQVSAVLAQCQPLAGGRPSHISFGNTDTLPKSDGFTMIPQVGADPVPTQAPQICADGDVAVGMQINWGRHVNAAGLVCDELKRAIAVAPVPPRGPAPEPIKSTGKGPSGAPQQPAPPADASLGKWLGAWATRTSNGGQWTITFTGSGDELRGVFRDVGGNARLSGQFHGRPNGNTLSYTYLQPVLPGGAGRGSGTFVISDDGKKISGRGVADTPQKATFTWSGEKTQASVGPK